MSQPRDHAPDAECPVPGPLVRFEFGGVVYAKSHLDRESKRTPRMRILPVHGGYRRKRHRNTIIPNAKDDIRNSPHDDVTFLLAAYRQQRGPNSRLGSSTNSG